MTPQDKDSVLNFISIHALREEGDWRHLLSLG